MLKNLVTWMNSWRCIWKTMKICSYQLIIIRNELRAPENLILNVTSWFTNYITNGWDMDSFVMIGVTIGLLTPWPWPLKVHFSCRGAGNRQNYRFPNPLTFTFPKVHFGRRGAVNRQNVNVSQPKSTFYVGSQPSGRTPTGLTSL